MRERKFKPLRLISSRLSAHRKSWPTTTAGQPAVKTAAGIVGPTAALPVWYRSFRRIWFYVIYIGLFLLASYLFYRRFPNNYLQPNFYGEDGYIFANNILHKGLVGSLLTTFNGYYIWGIYILAKLGFVLNFMFGHNEFANLPRYFAVASYLFLGFTITLPVLLFRNYIKPATLGLIVLLSLYVPLTGWDYAIVGTIGNTKFAIIYIAFLLLVYRQLVPENSKTIYVADIGLVICALTNVTVYPMLLFALLKYVPTRILRRPIRAAANLKRADVHKYLIRLLKTRSFWSLLIAGLLMSYQLVVIKLSGIPAILGYMDSPYHWNRTVEIFISRSYIYPVVYTFNKHLNDVIVIVIFSVLVAATIYFAKAYRKIVLFGLATIFFGTFLFVIKRTGVSDFYNGYHDGGPDQFFYAQNWVFVFVIGLAAGGLLHRLRQPYRPLGYIALLAIIFTLYIPRSGSFGTNNFMEKNVGNIYANAQAACSHDPARQGAVSVISYPATSVVYPGLARHTICTASVIHYTPAEVSLGLAPYNNNYVSELGIINKVNQTFLSPRNKLDGLDVYFSTFGKKVHSPYTLVLMDGNCKTNLQTIDISVSKLRDNSFSLIRFKPIDDSAQTVYCYSIRSKSTSGLDPLALQFSQPDIYTAGNTFVNGKSVATDVVFALHYKQ